jgi:hypothetical protein
MMVILILIPHEVPCETLCKNIIKKMLCLLKCMKPCFELQIDECVLSIKTVLMVLPL